VVFLGDSITSNCSASWAGTTFTSHATWINEGIVGENSNQLRARFKADVVTFHPQMVVILTGTNDVYPGWRGPCITSMVPLVFLNKINVREHQGYGCDGDAGRHPADPRHDSTMELRE